MLSILALVMATAAPPVLHERSDVVTYAYCDLASQPMVMLMNHGPHPITLSWIVTATASGDEDIWAGMSLVESGRYEGWLTGGDTLRLEMTWDDEGIERTRSLGAVCGATKGMN